MVWGIIFIIVVIFVGAKLVNDKDSEGIGQAVIGFIVLSSIIGLLIIIVNSLLDGCVK